MSNALTAVLIALTLACPCLGQITYRRKRSPTRIIAACVVAVLLALFLALMFAILVRRRRRAARYRITTIQQPYPTGGMPFQRTQNNPVPGAPPRTVGSTQYKYPEQAHYGAGVKPGHVQDDLPPSYKEGGFVDNSAVQNPVAPPDAAHTAPQTANDRFVGGFRT